MQFGYRLRIQIIRWSLLPCISILFVKMAFNRTNTVNSLVSDHPWCTTKWSLTKGGRLREKSRKRPHNELINVITLISFKLLT